MTFLVERDTLTSVWCFFAAVLGAQVLVAVRREASSGAGDKLSLPEVR